MQKKRQGRPHLTQEQAAQLRAEIISLRSDGLTVAQVAAEARSGWGLRWINAGLVACVLAVELARIDECERAAWRRWDESKANGPGDVRALYQLLNCVDRRCRLLQLYPNGRN